MPVAPKPPSWQRECVLPDGRFARIARPITGADTIKWYVQNPVLMHMGLLSEVVEIDGQKHEIKYYMEMDIEHYAPIANMLSEYVKSTNMKGVG